MKTAGDEDLATAGHRPRQRQTGSIASRCDGTQQQEERRMNMLRFKLGLAAGALSMTVLGAPFAIAAQDSAPGDTSGSASGKMTTPGTAAQKQTSTQTGSAAGGPGVEGKQGAESGAAPGAPKAGGQTKPHQ
jgi:hypothetical protein